MKNVYIGRVAGKHKFNKSLTGFAIHYGFKPRVAPPYAAWVKGKVERPYRFIREGFWRGYSYLSLERANTDLHVWLHEKNKRIHGTTHEKITERFSREQPCLGGLPPLPFDTSYRLYRTVYRDCTVRYNGSRYVLPHSMIGKKVVLRVKNDIMRVFHFNQLVVIYEVSQERGALVQNKEFYENLRKDKEQNKRKYGDMKPKKGRAKRTISPLKPLFEMDVEVRPIQAYSIAAGEV